MCVSSKYTSRYIYIYKKLAMECWLQQHNNSPWLPSDPGIFPSAAIVLLGICSDPISKQLPCDWVYTSAQAPCSQRHCKCFCDTLYRKYTDTAPPSLRASSPIFNIVFYDKRQHYSYCLCLCNATNIYVYTILAIGIKEFGCVVNRYSFFQLGNAEMIIIVSPAHPCSPYNVLLVLALAVVHCSLQSILHLSFC